MSKTHNPNSIRIGLMDPSIAQTWAQRILSDGTTVGSIKKGDTINHTTSQPIATGLFCQRIFGPCIDYTCACGHEKIRIGFNPNIAPPVCSECHVEWTHASVRRQFLGSIDLISPVTHKWFSDSRGAYIPTLLGITPRTFRNLKECKLFFPFGLKKGQESMQHTHRQQKKVNAISYKTKQTTLTSKNLVSPLRAMHTLKFLIDPQKETGKENRFLNNLQLTNNPRDFWFLSNKLLFSGNISIENEKKFSAVCMLANSYYFPKGVLNLVLPSKQEISNRSSIANKTFGKEIYFQNRNPINKVFSFLTKTPKFEGQCSSKKTNFDSLIATSQWLTIEQAFLVKQGITGLLAKKAEKPLKSFFSTFQEENQLTKFQESTNPLQLKHLVVKKQNFSVLASAKLRGVSKVTPFALARQLATKEPLEDPSLEGPCTTLKTTAVTQSLKKLTVFKKSFKNNDIISDWKAKSLFLEKNLEQKKIPTNNLIAFYAKRKQNQDHFSKKRNLKYVFVLAQKMENESSFNFSESFLALAFQNKQGGLKCELKSKTVLNTKEKTVLSFFEDVRKQKSQKLISKISYPFKLLARNGTYIFRHFTKYKFSKEKFLFSKNQTEPQLFEQSTVKTKFCKKYKLISKYKIGLLSNSEVGLLLTVSPFTLNPFFAQKRKWSIAETTVKRLFLKSHNKWLLNKEKKRIFSLLQCNSLLLLTGTKLWYFMERETLASSILKAAFYRFKYQPKKIEEEKSSVLSNLRSITQSSKPFGYLYSFLSSRPESFYLINLLSFSKERQKQLFHSNTNCFRNKTNHSFYRHHNFPIRPSYTQPEDYRRQFLKFLGNNSFKKKGDVPILRYIQAQLTNTGQLIENLVKYPTRSAAFLSDKAIEVYFSEAKSVAKEQTIKKILKQTGGGGLQTYLELINLSELVLILQNDLSEIAPRLSKSQSTRRVLLSIINDTSNSLTEAFFLLRKKNEEETRSKDFLSFNKEDLNKPSAKQKILTKNSQLVGSKSSPPRVSTKNRVLSSSKTITFNKEKDYGNVILTGETKETSYPNYLLLSEKIEVLEKKCKDVKKEYKAVKKICSDFQNRKNAHKRRYKLAFQLLRTMSNPAGMTMSSVPVLPPGLRPIIDVPKIGPITADLNIRYRSLLFALRNLRELAYVDFRNAGAAQASVQEAVDDLLYTGGKTRREKPSSQNPNLYKSLAMRLKGKHGRFRGNLLGKRVDYSGRSVIVVGPTLKIHQCGLPFEIAIKLFNPFLIRSLIQRGFCKNVYKAKQILIRGKFKPLIWTLCQEVMSEHLVLLNRAPTLHRLGVQAFMPVLISGRAILLHPLVCTGFNADFDGDQMGVHVPLFPQARAEAWKMMWSRNNFLLPSSGEPVLLPSQDMVLGCYYLTCSTQKILMTRAPEYNDSLSFPFTILSPKTALNGYNKGTYNIQSIVWVNPHKTRFLNSGDRQKHISIKPFHVKVEKMEDDGLLIPTLELRITPFGVMRLLYTSGIKSFTFKNSLLLPGRQAVKPPVFSIFVRTTIGRLIFNNLLEDIKSS